VSQGPCTWHHPLPVPCPPLCVCRRRSVLARVPARAGGAEEAEGKEKGAWQSSNHHILLGIPDILPSLVRILKVRITRGDHRLCLAQRRTLPGLSFRRI